MRPSRFRPAALLAALLLIAGVVAWLMQKPATPTPAQPALEQRMAAAMPQESATTPAPAALITTAAVDSGPRDEELREMQAYRLAVRAGMVSLDGVETIQGDFRKRRGPLPWMPGMWCVRLLDADMRVLAEDTAAAPDAMCVVLDPQNKNASGTAQATQFAGAGEEAMLQVRLPPQPDAKWLKVYRLGGMQRADWNTEPLGQLLVSIPLL